MIARSSERNVSRDVSIEHGSRKLRSVIERAKGVVRQKIKHLQRKGDHGGVVAWTAVAHQLSRIPATDFERDRRT